MTVGSGTLKDCRCCDVDQLNNGENYLSTKTRNGVNMQCQEYFDSFVFSNTVLLMRVRTGLFKQGTMKEQNLTHYRRDALFSIIRSENLNTSMKLSNVIWM